MTAYKLTADSWRPLPCGGRALVREVYATHYTHALSKPKRRSMADPHNLATVNAAHRSRGGTTPKTKHQLGGEHYRPPHRAMADVLPPGYFGQLGTRSEHAASRKRGNAKAALAECIERAAKAWAVSGRRKAVLA